MIIGDKIMTEIETTETNPKTIKKDFLDFSLNMTAINNNTKETMKKIIFDSLLIW